MKKKKNAWLKVDVKLGKQKKAEWKVDFLSWITCPYCKNAVISGGPVIVGALKKWHSERVKAEKTKKRTRTETREFDPASNNGRLMMKVCSEVVKSELQKMIEETAMKLEKISVDDAVMESGRKVVKNAILLEVARRQREGMEGL